MKRIDGRICLLLSLSLMLSACGGGGGGGGDDENKHPPSASFTLNPSMGDAPLQVTFDASGSSDSDGSITAYDWSFGDGQDASGVTASYTYTSAGSYRVSLTVTDDSGMTDSTSSTVTVNEPGEGSFSISGTLRAADNIAVDSDLNDPLASYAANDGFDQAQAIGNPVMLNGFVNETATGVAGDRFELSADTSDTFRVSLYNGQYVSLRVASFDSTSPTANDVDFRLFDTGQNLIATSETTSEFESVAVPADGEYFIQVYAYSGANKYVLSVGSSSLASSDAASGWSAEFLPDQAIIKRSPHARGTQPDSSLIQLRGVALSHASLDRPSLLRLTHEATYPDLTAEMQTKAMPKSLVAGQQSLPTETRRKIETLNLIKQLNLRQDVATASPNFLVRATLEPNDSLYGFQEHYRQIRLPQAWDLTTGTPATGEVVVAVVDSGQAMDHEDFNGQLVAGYDFISDVTRSNDGDGIDADPNDPGSSTMPGESVWHGTHVAGTIAAASNNDLGVSGVSWGAKIMPLRVLGLGGSGSYYDILQALRYAASMDNDSNRLPAQPADIINLSLGGKDPLVDMENLLAEIRDRGVVVIAAAGNKNSSDPFYPASYEGVISVSAMDWQNNKASYSNFGSTIDIAAPGGDTSVDNNGDGFPDGVLSTIMKDTTGERVSNYLHYQGTSMASPHVAGVVALMKAVHPGLTPLELDSLLVSGEMTNDLGEAGRDDIYGYGMLDALKSVQAAQAAAGGMPVNTVVASPAQVDFGTDQLTANVMLAGNGTTPPSVTSFTSSESWLNVAAQSVDANGLGDYLLTIDRSGLVDAAYTARVDFGLSDGKRVSVSVSMRVRSDTVGTSGNAGYLYLVLFDLDLNNRAQVSVAPVDGAYVYQLSNIAPDDYYLLAGSDVDNDGNICEVGESCGAYPVRNQEEVISVDRDLSGIDFVVTINSGLSGSAATRLVLPEQGISIKPSAQHQESAP